MDNRTLEEIATRDEEKTRIDEDGLDRLGASIPQNKEQGFPKPRAGNRPLIVQGEVRRIAPIAILDDDTKKTHTQFTREEGESMQEFSDRLDREKLKQEHSWTAVEFVFGSYMECKCGVEARSQEEMDAHVADIARRQKKPFERPEHLQDRPFTASLELRELQRKLHADKRVRLESRRGQKSINPKAKRQR